MTKSDSNIILLNGGMTPEYWKNKSIESIQYTHPDGTEQMERWLPIEGFDGLYEISDLGRVKSHHDGDKICTITPSDERNYLRATLSKNGIDNRRYVHRLVGQYFLNNPHKKRTINHKKGITWDNRYFELEWNTHSENHKHAYDKLNRQHSQLGRTGYKSKRSKEIMCVTTGQVFGSLSEAGRILNIPFQNISKVCKGKRPSAHNLVFKYTNE